jgi:hypothetical protein
MGPEDAAVLLAAVAASDDASHAPESVRKLYALPFAGLSPNNDGEFVAPSFLGKIIGAEEGAINTFGRALVAIMKHLVATPDYTHSFAFEVSVAGGVPFFADLEIFEKPNPADPLHVDVDAELKSRHVEFLRTTQMRKTIWKGLRVRRYVSFLVIYKLAEVLSGRIAEGLPTEDSAPASKGTKSKRKAT